MRYIQRIKRSQEPKVKAIIKYIDPYSVRELFALTAVFVIVFTLVFTSRFMRIYNGDAIFTEENTVLYLSEKTDLNTLSNTLYQMKIINDPIEFEWAGKLLGWRSFMPGRYETGERYSYDEFMSKLARGIQDETQVTVLPGLNAALISRNLARQLQADSSEFARIFTDSSEVALELGVTGSELAAKMLPESYKFFWNTKPETAVRRIHREFERIVTDGLSEEIEESDLTIHEILTLASIVEWEAKVREEKRKISGLYLNRLDRNMRLQADPTVIYALGEKRRLLFEDYKYEHPYNTYLINGLPPGPITNPDLESIKAVLHPANHNYLYMVATPDGSHMFSRTFEEHKIASDVWRKYIREQTRIRRQLEKEAEMSSN